MSRIYDLITFDCYGTLVDWEGGIAGAFRDVAVPAHRFDRDELLALHAEIEPQVQFERYRSYREVLEETAMRIANRLGWGLPRDRAGFLPESLAQWPVFADTVPALRRLADAGHQLGILSNVDDDLLAGTVGRLGVEFRLIVTAEQVGSYKPAHGHFLEARRRIGEQRWLHVAQSWFHDVVPASQLGIPVAWINRKSEPLGGDAAPVRNLRLLQDLADWLAPST